MLTVDDYGAIRRARRDGQSIRRIARELGLSRITVRKALKQPQPVAKDRDRPAPKLGPFQAAIDQILADDESAPPKQRHTAAQVYRRLRDESGYPGGYAQVQRYVRRHRRKSEETFIPLGHRPGQRLEADFGHIHVDFPIKACAPARIVTVASEAHRRQRLDLGTLGKGTNWGQLKAYGRSKLCNILFTRELAERLAGSGVVATCLHPGIVATGIGQHGGIIELGWRLMKPFMIGPEKGAETSLSLATVPDPTPFHGGYVIGRTLARPDPAALDAGVARRLWDESARMVGL